MDKFFSIYGKATRSEYWGVICISLLAALFGMMFLGGFMMAVDSSVIDTIGGIAVILLGAITVYIQLAVAARRCRDIDINPWFSLTVAVPYIGLIPFVIFGCLPTAKKSQLL